MYVTQLIQFIYIAERVATGSLRQQVELGGTLYRPKGVEHTEIWNMVDCKVDCYSTNTNLKSPYLLLSNALRPQIMDRLNGNNSHIFRAFNAMRGLRMAQKQTTNVASNQPVIVSLHTTLLSLLEPGCRYAALLHGSRVYVLQTTRFQLLHTNI